MYVIKMKQAQIANGTTATARATTSNENESNARRKRQAEAGNGASIDPAMSECEETEYTYNVTASDGRFISQEVYSVWNCSNGSAFMDFGGKLSKMLKNVLVRNISACGVEMRTKSFPASKLNSWKNDMATIFYKCVRLKLVRSNI